MLGDVDRDGDVDAFDLSDLGEAYGSTPELPNWNVSCDFDANDLVDVLDLFSLGKNYGRTAHNPELFQDGFESGDINNWNGTYTSLGGSATVVDTISHDGTYSAMFSGIGEGGWDAAYSYVDIPSSSELYARGYFRVTSSGLTEDNDRFYSMTFVADGYSVASVGWWRVDGVIKWSLQMWDGASWWVAYSDSSPSLDQWYSVELRWKSHAVSGLAELYVNGELVASITDKNTSSFSGVSQISFGLPELAFGGPTTVYGDNFIASEKYIGPSL
jgi:hypothetical protein